MSEHAGFVVDMDLTDTQAWGGEDRPLVPPGDYRLTIAEMEQKPSSKGTPLIVVTYVVADEGEYNGMKIWNNYPLTDNAKGRIKALAVAAGASLNKIDSSEFIGATIVATVVHVDGEAKADANGVVRPAKTFANVINERPDEAQAQVQAQTPKQPPVTKGAPVAQNTKPAGNNAARRA